jgi:hypothetical protein
MKLGLEWIMGVTSTLLYPTTIQRKRGAKVSLDVYKSVGSAIGSGNLRKIFQILGRPNACTTAAGDPNLADAPVAAIRT